MGSASTNPAGVRLWLLADVLALPTSDRWDVVTGEPWCEGVVTVADVLAGKRRWSTYGPLLADVRQHGLRVPLRYCAPWHVLYDGHTRAAVAQELGLSVVPVLTTLDALRED